jgi:hypothetical protein
MIPSPAIPIPALIAFVQGQQHYWRGVYGTSDGEVDRMFSALLTVLERQQKQDDEKNATRSVRPDAPSTFSIHAPTDTKGE